MPFVSNSIVLILHWFSLIDSFVHAIDELNGQLTTIWIRNRFALINGISKFLIIFMLFWYRCFNCFTVNFTVFYLRNLNEDKKYRISFDWNQFSFGIVSIYSQRAMLFINASEKAFGFWASHQIVTCKLLYIFIGGFFLFFAFICYFIDNFRLIRRLIINYLIEFDGNYLIKLINLQSQLQQKLQAERIT